MAKRLKRAIGFVGDRLDDVRDEAVETVRGFREEAPDVLRRAMDAQSRIPVFGFNGPQGMLEDLGRPAGALVGALGGENPAESVRGFVRGAQDPEWGARQGRNVGFVRNLPDEDLWGEKRFLPDNISARDIGGGIAAAALDPLNLIGAGPATRAARGLNAVGDAGAIRRAAGPVESATRGALRQKADGAIQSAVEFSDEMMERFGVPYRPRVSGGAVPPARTPEANVFDLIHPGEKPEIGVLRRYEGELNTHGLEVRRDMDRGNRFLGSLGVGRPTGSSRVVERYGEMEDLFKALHGEGPVPPRLQPVFDDLKAALDIETAATLDFDPKFMARPDYFPRGWREVDLGKPPAGMPRSPSGIGTTPGFAKNRVEETFTEMLEKTYTRPDGTQYKLEPKSWNPYEMLALRRIDAAQYRAGKEMVERLKVVNKAIPVDGPLPDGWRVPKVGPAFEGKSLVAPPDANNAAPSFFGYTDRYAVPDSVADVLENNYGARVSLGKYPEKVLDAAQNAKRIKLMGSLFQQIDFSTRTGFAMWGGAADDLLSGKPVSAVAKMLKSPVEVGNLVRMNVSPQGRAALRDEILSGKPIFKERPGISLRGVAEAGWQQQDFSIVRRDISNTLKDIAARETEKGLAGLPQRAKRNLGRLEAANQRGLFDGVYPQAQTVAIKNWVLPRLVRQHPDWTDQQIMGQAADEINKAFSTLGDYQTVFKNPYMNHLTHHLIFSTNEAESLLRGAGSAFHGNNKRLWGTFYLGGAMMLGAVANLAHMATTTITEGRPEPLPFDRYNPLRTSEKSPLGIGYNSAFLSPDIPLRGTDGDRLTLDLVGQMDTAFRILDPVGFISSRESVAVRALANQLTGRDYDYNEIDTVGPKGIVSRAAQAVSDLYEPIGASHLRKGLEVGGDKREPVGLAGEVIQAAGPNLRNPSEADGGAPARKSSGPVGRPSRRTRPTRPSRRRSRD
jgi:hypothetical protein